MNDAIKFMPRTLVAVGDTVLWSSIKINVRAIGVIIKLTDTRGTVTFNDGTTDDMPRYYLQLAKEDYINELARVSTIK